MYSFEQCRQELLNYLTRNSISARDVIKKIFLFTMNEQLMIFVHQFFWLQLENQTRYYYLALIIMRKLLMKL